VKIALVANAYPPHFIGGAEIAAHRQAVELVGRGHELSCFCTFTDPHRPAYEAGWEDVDGVTVRRLNVPEQRFASEQNFRNPVVEDRFAQFLAARQPHVVHFHNMPGTSLGLFDVCEDHGVPSMITFHDHWGFCLRHTLVRRQESRVCPDWSECHVCLDSALLEGVRIPTFLRTDYIRLKLHKASLFHFPSRYLQDAYGKAHFDMRRAVQHTYGVARDWFEAPLELPPIDRIRAVFVGYFGRHKGPHILLQGLRLLEDRKLLDHWTVELYGHGEMQAELAQTIAERGWGGTVIMRGKADNAAMRSIYAGADLMLNCSLWPENEPVTILEALACGTPVVATRRGGNIELLREGENGWLYEAASPEALADQLEAIAAQPDTLRAMRPQARASVAPRTIASYGDFALEAYRSLELPTTDTLPSIVAVACSDFSKVDTGALWRLSKTGYWAGAEWVLADALHGQAELASVVVVLSLDGQLPRRLVRDLPASTPVIVVGVLGSCPGDFERFEDVLTVRDLAELAGLGVVMLRWV